ncbi:protein SSUH2 homolog [Clarias gariepinus]
MSAFAAPTATPAGYDDTVPGYHGNLEVFAGQCLPPPMPSVPVPSLENLPAQPERNITSITEEDAREAFISYASSKCCYRSAPAQEGVITKLEPFDTHREKCSTCNGSGSCDGTDCSDCNGFGEKTCSRCNGKGTYQCTLCQGKKQLLVFMTLKIQWITYKKDFVVEQSSGLKSKKFNKVSGKVMFTDSQRMVGPVVDFQDASLRQASERFIQKHQSKYSHILQQRHTIELIPVTKVNYTWKGKFHSYIVFGNENRVSTKSYPAACCCSVM